MRTVPIFFFFFPYFNYFTAILTPYLQPDLAQAEGRLLAEMDLLAEAQEGEEFIEIPRVADPPHQAAHEHLLILPAGIALPIEPTQAGFVRGHGLCPGREPPIVEVRIAVAMIAAQGSNPAQGGPDQDMEGKRSAEVVPVLQAQGREQFHFEDIYRRLPRAGRGKR